MPEGRLRGSAAEVVAGRYQTTTSVPPEVPRIAFNLAAAHSKSRTSWAA